MKIGLIGCGGIAPSHIKAYSGIDEADVVALCDLNIERANILAKKFKIRKTYQNYWDMIESNELDIVDVCTPINTHSNIVSDIAKAVPAIFLEKPMALTVKECDDIISSLNKYGTKCCINHLQIFSPNINKVGSLINNGEFDLFSLKLTHKESYDYLQSINLAQPWNVSEKHGGILWEVCSHPGYIQQKFLPNIEEVYALGGKTKYEVFDNFIVLLKTADGKFGCIEINWVSKESEVIYEFTDLNGKRIKLHYYDNYISEHTNKPSQSFGNVINNMVTEEFRYLHKWYRFAKCYINKCKELPMKNICTEFIASIKTDQPSPVTPEDGRNLIILLESIKKSLETGEPVKL